MIADLGNLDRSSGTDHGNLDRPVDIGSCGEAFCLFWRSHTRSGRSIDAMFYVKHLTHAHFVRGRTDRYIYNI